MQKVQKTYTAEFKREAVRLAQTSGKPITHIARELGIDFYVNPSMAQGAD
jgi:transposase